MLGDVRVIVLGPDYAPDLNSTSYEARPTRTPARTCFADDNIVSDGCFVNPTDFEDESITSYTLGATIGAWVVTGGSVKRKGRKAYAAPNCCPFTLSLDLQDGSRGAIAQTLWTIPNNYYAVSFAVS